MKIILLSALLLFTVASECWGYIPDSRTILNRTARNSGRGFYVVEQEVTFRSEAEPIVLLEKWIVENGENLRVSVSNTKGAGETYRYEALYKEGRKMLADNGQVRTLANPNEMFEGIFHFRSGRGLLDALLRHKLIPANLSREPRRFAVGVKYVPEASLRLGRTAGVVAYVMGDPTPHESTTALPGVWIEQDTFLLRRLRYPSQADVVADRHMMGANGLRFPRERSLTWNQNSVSIRVLSIKTINEAQARAALNPTSLTQARGPVALPAAESVKEFYSRFR